MVWKKSAQPADGLKYSPLVVPVFRATSSCLCSPDVPAQPGVSEHWLACGLYWTGKGHFELADTIHGELD